MSPQILDESEPTDNETISERILDSVQGKDEPMEESHPEAPPLLVFASYPLVLILGIIVALVAVWFLAI